MCMDHPNTYLLKEMVIACTRYIVETACLGSIDGNFCALEDMEGKYVMICDQVVWNLSHRMRFGSEPNLSILFKRRENVIPVDLHSNPSSISPMHSLPQTADAQIHAAWSELWQDFLEFVLSSQLLKCYLRNDVCRWLSMVAANID